MPDDNIMEPDEFRPSFGNAPAASRHSFFPSIDDEFRPSEPIIDDEDNGDSTEFDAERALRRGQHRQPIDITTPASANFLPSFFRDAQPHGHSRPYFTPTSKDAHRFNGNRAGAAAAQSNVSPQPAFDQTILGSGDFGVIRGGTFYQENDPPIRGLESNDYYSFYKNNGHGRPQTAAFTGARPLGYNEEQFSNFRDFADINTPSDPAFSQFVVVYANKNATRVTAVPYDNAGSSSSDDTSLMAARPKNIFEQLEALDREKSAGARKSYKQSSAYKPSKSTFKQKLAATKREKTYRKQLGPKEHDFEPLMALS